MEDTQDDHRSSGGRILVGQGTQSEKIPISYPESSDSLVSGLVARRDSGEMEFFHFFFIGYSGNNEIGEAEVGSM